MIEDVRYRNKHTTKEKFVVKGSDVQLALDKREKTTKSGLVIELAGSREAEASERGVIVQKGNQAFAHLDDDEKYEIGDKVVITRYSGKHLGVGEDGLERVCIADTGIHALAIEDTDENKE